MGMSMGIPFEWAESTEEQHKLYPKEDKTAVMINRMLETAGEVERRIFALEAAQEELEAAFEQARPITFGFRDEMLGRIRKQYGAEIQNRKEELRELRTSIARLEAEGA